MNKDKIKEKLLSKGYSEKGALHVAENLMRVDKRLQPLVEAWATKDIEGDYSAEGYSIFGLKSTFKMKYPAALLSIDWLMTDPKTALVAIKKGIR